MNKRGQALVEFVIILPVLLLIVFAFIDFGRIILCKSHLENVMDTVILVSQKGEDVNHYLKTDKDYYITYSVEYGEYEKISLETKLDLITPGLKNILKNPYKVTVERNIIYE